jgi:hypothetical protein
MLAKYFIGLLLQAALIAHHPIPSAARHRLPCPSPGAQQGSSSAAHPRAPSAQELERADAVTADEMLGEHMLRVPPEDDSLERVLAWAAAEYRATDAVFRSRTLHVRPLCPSPAASHAHAPPCACRELFID